MNAPANTYVIGNIVVDTPPHFIGGTDIHTKIFGTSPLSKEARRALIVPGQIITEDMIEQIGIERYGDILKSRLIKPVTVKLTDGRSVYIGCGRLWGPYASLNVIIDGSCPAYVIPAPQVAGRRRSTRKTRRGRRSTRRRHSRR